MASLSGCRFKPNSNLRIVLQNRGIRDPLALDLIEKLLHLNPSKRISAKIAAQHPWFTAEPRMFELSQMPRYEESHELAMKNKRAMEKSKMHKSDMHQKPPHQGAPVYHPAARQDMRSNIPQVGRPGGFHPGRGGSHSMPKWYGEKR